MLSLVYILSYPTLVAAHFHLLNIADNIAFIQTAFLAIGAGGTHCGTEDHWKPLFVHRGDTSLGAF